MTAANHRDLLRDARGQTKQQLLERLARRWPKADVSSQLRRIPTGAVAAGPSGTLEPRSAESYCLQLNASQDLKAKLEEARDLMSHANPSGDLAVVVERALDVLLEKLKKHHFGQTSKGKADRPRSARDGGGVRPEPDKEPTEVATSEPRRRRRVRRAVRRQVVERDGETCSHENYDGERCGARAFLQLHHEQPWALGGADSAANLRWLCRAHNRLRAEVELGIDYVEQAIERQRRRAGGGDAAG